MIARALLSGLTACSLLLSSACAQPARPDSPVGALLDSLQKANRIGPVALSPDGKTVAMVLAGALTLQSVSDASSTRTPAVCPNSSHPDDDKLQVNSLAWAPDSQHLGILAICGEATGVYLLDLPRTKARRLAELHGFAEALEYAPDGKHLALLYVEGASRPSGALAAIKPPSGVIGVEGLEIQRVATIDAASGTLEQVTPPTLHVYEFSWSPDSTTLAYVAAPPPGENNWWVAKLYTQPLIPPVAPTAILDPATVTGSLHGLQIAVPRWSPDSKQIALIGGLMSDQGATGGDLYLLPSNGSGGPVDVTPDSATTVEWIDWLPDGRIAATKITDGSDRIDLLTLHPGLPAAPAGTSIAAEHSYDHKTFYEHLPYSIGDGRLAGSFSLSSNGAIAAWSASSYTNAPEVYAGPLSSTPPPAITHINDAQKPSWGKTESITWTNDNFNVQGWLFYPARYDPAKKYPMIVMVHGGPSSAVIPRWPGAGFGAAPFSAMGYFVLEANPRGSYGEGEAFTQANRKDFGYGDLRDILAGVDAVEHQIPSIDDKRIGVTGWSYGGFMTMFSVTQTQRFRAAVAGAGISDWLSYYGENSIDQWMTPFFGATVYDDPAIYARSSAINYIKQVHTPTLVVVGDRDGECPAPQSFEFWHALKAEGVDTQLVVYPNEGHGFVSPEHRRDVIERAVGWFDTHMQ
jgi:dipeptidyl aminopeptidase/acylaminoacyl peptidase